MESVKVIINGCFGGFGLSPKALDMISAKKGHEISEYDIERWDPDLVAVVEELGQEANGQCAELKIVEILKGKKFIITEYDGTEGLMIADEVDWIVL